MNEFSNNLTDAQVEALAWLSEECGEVVQIVGKILRHGYESRHPSRPEGPTNRDRLAEELGNLAVVKVLLESSGDLNPTKVTLSFMNKLETANKYLHFNEVG